MSTTACPALDIERFERQLIVSGWSSDQQRRLGELRIALVGQLPESLALYLAGLGVGELRLVETAFSASSIAHLTRGAIPPDITASANQQLALDGINVAILGRCGIDIADSYRGQVPIVIHLDEYNQKFTQLSAFELGALIAGDVLRYAATEFKSAKL